MMWNGFIWRKIRKSDAVFLTRYMKLAFGKFKINSEICNCLDFLQSPLHGGQGQCEVSNNTGQQKNLQKSGLQQPCSKRVWIAIKDRGRPAHLCVLSRWDVRH
jgi:hypothetical protein